MALQFRPPEQQKRKSREEALLEPIGQAIQTLPGLWAQHKLTRLQQDRALKEEIRAQKEMEAKYGTGVAENIAPGQLVSAPPPSAGPEEQLLGFEATPPTFSDETEEQKLRRMGTVGYGAMTDRLKAEKESPLRSVDAILAQKVQSGEMTLEDAIKAKQSLIPPTTILSPTGETVGVAPGKTVTLPQPNASQAKAAGESAEADITAEQGLAEMDRLLPLNSESRGGFFGKIAQRAESAIDPDKPSKKFENTADVINSLKSVVAKTLKSTFGGQLSDGERQYLNEVYGAVEGMSRKEREISIKGVKRTLLAAQQRASGKASAMGANVQSPTPTGGDSSLPQVGQTFQGGKVLKIRRID